MPPASPRFVAPLAVLGPIASALVQVEWQEAPLKQVLLQRLPARLRNQAGRMAQRLILAFPGGSAPDVGRLRRKMGSLSLAPRLLDYARRTATLPAPVLAQPQFRPAPRLAGLDLPELATPADLADFLAISPDALIRFADLRGLSARSPDPFGPHYLCHLQPKRRGGMRLIEAPRPFLKTLQRRILHAILNRVPPHEAAFGFRRGRNCVMAAARHAGEQVVLGFDLADFFPGLDQARVYGLFRSLGYPAAAARDLAGLCTALTPARHLAALDTTSAARLRARHLPQGAPTSPALANLLAFRLDCRLSALARSLGAQYTRYADDLTFSGDARIAPILLRAVPEIVTEEGFRPHPGKTRLQPAHQQQRVTGIVVNRHTNLPRASYDQLKATLHHLRNPDDPRRHDPAFMAQLAGRIAWLAQLNPQRAARLSATLETLSHQPGPAS